MLEAAPEITELGAERALYHWLDRQELAYALSHVTGDLRQAVILRFLEGLSTAETAERMGKTEDAVKKLQARGLLALKRALRDKELLLAA